MAAIKQHMRRTQVGHEVVDFADAIALSEVWNRVSSHFASAMLHIYAAHATPTGDQGVAYSSTIGGEGIPAGLLGAVNKVNAALMRPRDRHNEELALLGRHDHRYRLGDVISTSQVEDLLAAQRALSAVVDRTPKPVKATGPGRPMGSDEERDARVAAAWKSGEWATKADLDRFLDLEPGFTDLAVDRHSNRLRRGKGTTQGSDKPRSRG